MFYHFYLGCIEDFFIKEKQKVASFINTRIFVLPFFPIPILDLNCYTQPHGEDYRGYVSVTVTGKQCQQWTLQSPQGHDRTPENYPYSGLGPHNFCRNPDGERTVWCYTTDPDTRFELCDIGEPQPSCIRGELAVSTTCHVP